MLNTKFYISLLDFYQFDRDHYVIGQNENMLRVKVKQYDNHYGSKSIKVCKYRNYWADHIMHRESQSVIYKKVSEGIVDNMIHGFDNIIIACGPHCSGKTFNIMGWNRKNEGIASKMIDEMLAKHDGGVYAMSCVEIKDNRLFDLLQKDDNNSKRSCLMKNVSKCNVGSSESAKQRLWQANARRITVQDEKGVPSHIHDFVITLYRYTNTAKDDASCAKVQILEVSGAGPNISKPLKHYIQANRTMLELSQFLEHVVNINIKDNHHSIKNRRSSTSSLMLLKYIQGSFSKQSTKLRIICHIRPELSFLNANISVLNFGKFLRELPDSVINLSYLNLETIELYKQKEHLKHELYLYENLKGHRSMANMTVARYEELRKTVLDFLQLKINNIDILNWSYAEMFIILSMFREYFEQLIPAEENTDKIISYIQFKPFSLKSKTVQMNSARKLTENIELVMNYIFEKFDNISMAKRSYWAEFMEENSSDFSDQIQKSHEIRNIYRSFEIDLSSILDGQEKLIKLRDRLDELRRKRHCFGNELYDDDMNIIVSTEEKCMFQHVKEADMEMVKSINDFSQMHASLNQLLISYSKCNDRIQTRFEKFIINKKEKMIANITIQSVKSMTKSISSIKINNHQEMDPIKNLLKTTLFQKSNISVKHSIK